MAKALPKDVRQARAFLFQRNLGMISPKSFAEAAIAMQLSFDSLIKRIARIYYGEQAAGPFPATTEALKK